MKMFQYFNFFPFNTEIFMTEQSNILTFQVDKNLKPTSFRFPSIPFKCYCSSFGDSITTFHNFSIPYFNPKRIQSKELRIPSHGLFYNFLQAYHFDCPLYLSPDDIWLLICQGFSYHVNNNSDALRHLFVDFEKKKNLWL